MTWQALHDANKDYSLVVGKNSYTRAPFKPTGWPSAVTGTWSASIPKSSKHKSLASEFVAWWTDYDNAKRRLNPARADLLSDKELAERNPWVDIY